MYTDKNNPGVTSFTNQGFMYCDMIYNVLIKKAHTIYRFAYLGLKYGVTFFTMHTLKTFKIKSA